MRALQSKLYNLIREDDENTLSGTVFDTVIIVFILLNIVFILVDTFNPPGWISSIAKVVEGVSVVVFTLEYLLRIWTAPLIYPDKKPIVARLKYMFSFMAIIDLVSILPVFLPLVFRIDLRVLRGVRIFRLLRVFKIGRYADGVAAIGYVLKKKAHQLASSMVILFMMLLIASVIMYELEHTVQPEKFDNALSAFWWAVSTVTTLGYGDVYPITAIGKFVGIIIVLLGIGVVAVPTGIISAGFVEAVRWQERQNEAKNNALKTNATKQKDATESLPEDMRYCPYCGHKHDLIQDE